MSTIRLEKNELVLLDDARKRHVLVNVFDLYGNHSAMRMHALQEDSEAAVDYPFTRQLAKVIGESTVSNAYRSVCFRMASLLLEKQRDCRVLVLGDGNWEWLASLDTLLKGFNSANRLYVYHEQAGESLPGLADCRVNYCDLLLPQRQFDLVFLDDAAGNLPIEKEFWEQVVLSLKTYGGLWMLSARPVFHDSVPEPLQSRHGYSFGDGVRLSEYRLSVSGWQAVYADTLEAAAGQLTKGVSIGLQALGDCLMVPAGQYDALIEQVDLLEQYVLALYPRLDSLDIKYYLNRLKEAMIGFRLGQGEQSEVRAAYQQVCEEWLSMNPEAEL